MAERTQIPVVVRSAVTSGDGVYRYRLGRVWQRPLAAAARGHVTWVMLNPSTADEQVDDPTIRRCLRFSDDFGYRSLTVVNLFALRATSPTSLAGHPDPVGPENRRFVAEETRKADLVVVAWGAGKVAQAGYERLRDVLRNVEGRVRCLGVTASGAPRHPLYVRADTPLEPWPVAVAS